MKKKLLLTGSNGFIGNNLYKHLKNHYQIFCLVKKKRRKNDISCNLNNKKLLKKKLGKKKFDIVIDCAWEGVQGKFRNNLIQKKNLLYIKNLINSINIANIKTFISFGSQAEYGLCNRIITEKTITNPTTYYGKIKLKKYKYLKDLFWEKKIRFLWIRLFSSYGQNESLSWVMPYIINSLLKNKSPILTLGYQNWNFLHIFDICKAISLLLKTKDANGIFNLAYPRTIKIKVLANKIIKTLKTNNKIIYGLKKFRTDQVMNLKVNIKKLKDYGWYPKISIDTGIKLMINFYKSKQISK